MESEIQINNTAGVCQIDIEGTIGVPEEWQFEEPDARVATYERFRDTLRRIAEIEAPEVVVNIRSTGGDVNDALLIHDALRQLPARVTTRCYGYTASAATIIAQAASEGCRLLSANALYLIHTAICSTEGNAAEIAGKIDLLHQTDARIAAVYASRSGRPAAEFEALMAENNGNGRWLAPEEAVAAGLADKVVEAAEQPASSLARNIARRFPPTATFSISTGRCRLCAAVRLLRPTKPAGRPHRPPRSRARTLPAATRSARPTNAPMPKTPGACAIKN